MDKEKLDKLIDLLKQNNIEYEPLYKKLVSFFTNHSYQPPDLGADKTIDTVIKTIENLEERIDLGKTTIQSYIYSTAWNQLRDYRKKKKLLYVPVENLEQKLNASEFNIERAKILEDCVDSCFEKMQAADKKLMKKYRAKNKLQDLKSRMQLADELGLSLSNLRKKVSDLQKKWDECIYECFQKRINGYEF